MIPCFANIQKTWNHGLKDCVLFLVESHVEMMVRTNPMFVESSREKKWFKKRPYRKLKTETNRNIEKQFIFLSKLQPRYHTSNYIPKILLAKLSETNKTHSTIFRTQICRAEMFRRSVYLAIPFNAHCLAKDSHLLILIAFPRWSNYEFMLK